MLELQCIVCTSLAVGSPCTRSVAAMSCGAEAGESALPSASVDRLGLCCRKPIKHPEVVTGYDPSLRCSP